MFILHTPMCKMCTPADRFQLRANDVSQAQELVIVELWAKGPFFLFPPEGGRVENNLIFEYFTLRRLFRLPRGPVGGGLSYMDGMAFFPSI